MAADQSRPLESWTGLCTTPIAESVEPLFPAGGTGQVVLRLTLFPGQQLDIPLSEYSLSQLADALTPFVRK